MKEKDIKRYIQLEKEARARHDFGAAGRIRGMLKRAGVNFRGNRADYHETKRTNPPKYNPNGPN